VKHTVRDDDELGLLGLNEVRDVVQAVPNEGKVVLVDVVKSKRHAQAPAPSEPDYTCTHGFISIAHPIPWTLYTPAAIGKSCYLDCSLDVLGLGTLLDISILGLLLGLRHEAGLLLDGYRGKNRA
jgi:hypothetical protein